MAILNVFKKKKAKETVSGPKRPVAKPEPKPAPLKAKKPGNAWQILEAPHVTEKATDLTGRNQYIFRVRQDANKIEVKKAVENLYGVTALSVKMIRVPRRKRRLGKVEGWRKGYKKAIVRLKGGQKIEVLPR